MNLKLKKLQKVVNASFIIVSLITCIGYFVSISENLEASAVHHIPVISLVVQLFGLLLLSALINLYLVKGAARLIDTAEEGKSLYREYAMRDQLTGAYSRLYYEMKDSQNRYEFMSELYEPLTVIMIDIDGFKYINDTCGHITGDKVLKHLVHVIQDNITEKDRLIRYGGDEFLLILSCCDEAKLDDLMTGIELSMNNTGIKTPIGLSYGIYRLNAGDSIETAINKADKRMYVKKNLKKMR